MTREDALKAIAEREVGEYLDLREADLRYADLRYADLRYADLREADLIDANLRYANLSGADLREADLRYANLLRAKLYDVDLHGADLRYADLRYADLSGANLRYADLIDANLSGANLDAIKEDIVESFAKITPEQQAEMIALLKSGKIDGSRYRGECVCFCGTIAKLRGIDYEAMQDIPADASSLRERWFLGIQEGNTPETHQISAITVGWLEDFLKEHIS